jgi:hypothetical protein
LFLSTAMRPLAKEEKVPSAGLWKRMQHHETRPTVGIKYTSGNYGTMEGYHLRVQRITLHVISNT